MGGELHTFEDDVEEIASMGLLTERQAAVYLIRDVMSGGRHEAAAHMGVEPNTVDNHLAAARRHVEGAELTLARLREIDEELHPPVPDDE